MLVVDINIMDINDLQITFTNEKDEKIVYKFGTEAKVSYGELEHYMHIDEKEKTIVEIKTLVQKELQKLFGESDAV
jgi:hypothetical protein